MERSTRSPAGYCDEMPPDSRAGSHPQVDKSRYPGDRSASAPARAAAPSCPAVVPDTEVRRNESAHRGQTKAAAALDQIARRLHPQTEWSVVARALRSHLVQARYEIWAPL